MGGGLSCLGGHALLPGAGPGFSWSPLAGGSPWISLGALRAGGRPLAPSGCGGGFMAAPSAVNHSQFSSSSKSPVRAVSPSRLSSGQGGHPQPIWASAVARAASARSHLSAQDPKLLAAGLGSGKAAPTSSSDPSSPPSSSPCRGGSSQAAGGGEQSMSQGSGSPTPRGMASSRHSSPLFRGAPGSVQLG